MESFSKLDHVPSRTVSLGDKEYLFFGGTSYLGMGADAEFQKHCFKGAEKLGFSNGTSRSNNVQLGIYDQAESEAAARFGAEAAMICSSGFLAGQLAVQYFSGFGEIIYGPNSHPALWLEAKPISNYEFDEWARRTVSDINASKQTRFVVINDSLNNFRPQLFSFSEFSKIDRDKEVILIVDDSHGIGVTHQGRGVFSGLPSNGHIHKIVVASLAKGMGIDAGIVLADKERIAELKTSPVFLAASPPSPALLYAFLKSENLYRENRKKLKLNMDFFNQHHSAVLHYTEGFPVYYAENPELYRILLEKGIIISSFNYPRVTDPLTNRIVINSLHTEEDLRYLINCL